MKKWFLVGVILLYLIPLGTTACASDGVSEQDFENGVTYLQEQVDQLSNRIDSQSDTIDGLLDLIDSQFTLILNLDTKLHEKALEIIDLEFRLSQLELESGG